MALDGGQTVAYINTFLRRFGSEKVHLVGSTGEKSKLTFSKDDGDADFLMVSGMYGIDVTQLEFDKNTECFLRVKCNQESEKIGLDTIDGYISANTLREFKRELFTILRGIHSYVTSVLRCRLSDAESEDTLIPVPSKVGLASIRYRHLNLDEALLDWFKQYQYDYNREETRISLQRQWQDVQIHESDMKVLRRVLRIIQMIGRYGDNVVKSNSQLFHFASLLDDLTKRSSMAATRTLESETFDPGLEEAQEAKSVIDSPHMASEPPEVDIDFEEVRNTYTEKFHMDFVPAIKLNQKLDLMEDWRQRVSDAGIDIALVDDICNTDIFVVSKVSPINPQSDTDFCLSFNLAEMKLVSNMTPLQRKIFLCMKAFLKGVFDKTHKENNHEVKLKTFHIKHSLFWHFELNPDLSVIEDTPENVLNELKCAIVCILQRLEDHMLPHYFIGRNANLLADFEDIDYKLLCECFTMVLNDPIGGLQIYCDLDDGAPCDIVLSREEIQCLMTMTKDGGRNRHIDRLEDALIDIHRSFNLGPRDDDMRAPIKEAILDIFQLFLKDEQIKDTRVFEQINKFIMQGKTDSVPEVNEKVRNIAALLQNIGILFPTVKQFVDRFDGRPGIEEFLRGAFTGDPLNFTRDIDEQILQTVDKYLSCNEDEETVVASELVYKLVGYFSGRTRFPGLSEPF